VTGILPSPTATNSITPTLLPKDTQTETAELSPFPTEFAPFKQEWYWCGDQGPFITDFSPDGNWLASSCEHWAGNLSVINRNGTIWRITDKQLFGQSWQIVFRPNKWSNDAESLYFSTTYPWSNFIDPNTPDPNVTRIPWCFNPGAVTMVKLNLRTGTTTFILGNSDSYGEDPNHYAFSISPTEKFLAYSLQDRNHAKIILRNLENNRETKLSIEKNIEKDTAVTSLAWAADELTLNVQYMMCGAMLEKEVSVEVTGK
jgi:hypothetical protein